MTIRTQLIPAIDLKGGRCVRLEQGRFDAMRDYGDDPLSLAQAYVDQGARRLHLVDLDAAEAKGRHNTALIEQLAGALDVTLQVGGGLRTDAQLEALFDAGANRVVIGSLAIRDAARVKGWMKHYGPERVVLALDVQSASLPVVRIHGWQDATDVTVFDAIDDYLAHGLAHVLCTDISRDGMQSGPGTPLYASLLARYPDLRLQASGGVRHADDLKALSDAGVPFAISGRALLEGTLSVAETVT